MLLCTSGSHSCSISQPLTPSHKQPSSPVTQHTYTLIFPTAAASHSHTVAALSWAALRHCLTLRCKILVPAAAMAAAQLRRLLPSCPAQPEAPAGGRDAGAWVQLGTPPAGLLHGVAMLVGS
jgi:hypothetical protein